LGGSHQLCKLHSKSHSHKGYKKYNIGEAWNKIKLDVSQFRVFGSVAQAHISNENKKTYNLKVRSLFLLDSEDIKYYKLLQPHSNEIIIRRDVKFDETILDYEPNLEFVPSSACDTSSTFVSYSVSILVSYSLDDDSEPAPEPLLPRWVCSTREETGDISVDPSDQC
jgi:hypothetical protein